jgi:hypothetical protein
MDTNVLGLIVGAVGLVVGVLSVLFGAVSLVYAFMTNRRMGDRDALVRAQLRSFAGDIEQVSTSAGWANQHLVNIQAHALKLDRNPDVEEILKSAQLGAGDSVSAERMIRNFLNQILALQEGMFQTRDITHIDEKKH